MDERILMFFDRNMDALPLYERFTERVFAGIGDVSVKVQKTQISFSVKYMFACVSFARVRKKKDCPDSYIVVTFGLGSRVESPRIDVATEPYPNRWTHHVMVSELEDIDDALIGCIRVAAVLAAWKR